MLCFLRRISGFKMHLNLLKLVYLSHYLMSSKFEDADEVMAEVLYQFQEVKKDFKTRNPSKIKLREREREG